MNSHDAAETYRSLHTTIKYAAGDRPVRAVLIVDVDRPSTSAVAENVAAAFARAGDSCVLVNADFRGGSSDRAGFADLIRDPAASVEADASGEGPARLVPGTDAHPDLLASSRLTDALKSLRSRYDYLIVSCPPLPGYSDAVAIAPHVDATVLVISAGVTGRDEAVQAKEALERVGARILGMVMIERPRRWF